MTSTEHENELPPPKHPRGLWVLTATEVWERASYYGMLALLVLYLKEHLRMDEGQASNLMGTYTGLVYLAALPGGILADRWLGALRAVFLGGLLMVAGHVAMALGTVNALYAAIGLIAVGNGLFKPSMAGLVRNLYPPGDPRIDPAFSIFYVGVNVGAFVAPIGLALVRVRWGFHAAFGLAGVGLAVGMIQLALQRRHIQTLNMAVALVVESQELPRRATRQRIGAIVLMAAVMLFFWIAFGQNAGTMVFWAADCVDRRGVPTEMFESINPLFIMLLTAPVVRIFRHVSTPSKIVLGMLFTGAAFAVLALAPPARAHIGWFVGSCFAITVGELLVSPMGLAMVAKLAPPRYLGTLTGIWYLSTAAGNKLAGKLGVLWPRIPHAQFFALLVASSLLAAGFMQWRRWQLQDAIEEANKQDTGPIAVPEMATA